METPERRQVERHKVDLPGDLFLSEGRCIPVRILDLGRLGALVSVSDLEVAVLEGERVALQHAVLGEDGPTAERTRTAGSVVRVELDFSDSGVSRQLAVFFDGGDVPSGCP